VKAKLFLRSTSRGQDRVSERKKRKKRKKRELDHANVLWVMQIEEDI